MSIQDMQKINSRQLETLKRKNERELARMNEAHDNLKVELKKEQQAELVELQNQNIRQLSEENDKKEKVLAQMRDHLENSRRMTDKELRDLKEYTEKATKAEHDKLTVTRDQQREVHDLYLEDQRYKFDKAQRAINVESQQQLTDMKSLRQEELTDVDSYYKNKINQQTNNFTQRFKTDANNYQQIKDTQDKQFKNERFSTNIRQQQEMAKLTTNHNNVIEVKDKQFRKGIKDQELFFEDKYAKTLKTRNEELGRLEELNNKVMSKMKSDLQQKLETNINRSDDPFYKFTELKPSLKYFDDHVEISVDVPEHSKTDIQLTLHDKEAILSFNRRYDDSRKEGNVTNKVKKVESFTTRLMTNYHLSPKDVKSSYVDGVMTYTVKKA